MPIQEAETVEALMERQAPFEEVTEPLNNRIRMLMLNVNVLEPQILSDAFRQEITSLLECIVFYRNRTEAKRDQSEEAQTVEALMERQAPFEEVVVPLTNRIRMLMTDLLGHGILSRGFRKEVMYLLGCIVFFRNRTEAERDKVELFILTNMLAILVQQSREDSKSLLQAILKELVLCQRPREG